MNEACDVCGPAVRAAYRVMGNGELFLCEHCTNRLRPALFEQGWAIEPAGEHALMEEGAAARTTATGLRLAAARWLSRAHRA